MRAWWVVVAVVVGACHHHELVCPPAVQDADALLAPGATLVFGEIHGTREFPAALGSLACAATRKGRAIVGLEIWRDEQAAIDAYLASDGGPAAKRALLASPFWPREIQDGRSSEAMASLLDQLRAWHVRVIAFDVGSAAEPRDRDRAMSEPLIAARTASPDATLIVLTGNLHARMAGDAVWMGQYLARAVPNLATFDAAYGRGTAWVCDDSGCGEKPWGRGDDPGPTRITRDQVKLPDGSIVFTGHLHVGAISASKPAVNPR